MKKQILMAVAAAALAGGGNAATTYDITSNITGAQLWVAGYDLLAEDPYSYFSGLRFFGTAVDVDDDGAIDSAQVSMAGVIEFRVNDYRARQTFHLHDGRYDAGLGTTFESGGIVYEYEYSEENGGPVEWIEYSSYQADMDWFEMQRGLPGHNVQHNAPVSQTTAGLLLAPGTTALPGLWNGIVGGAGYDSGLATYVMFGANMGLFLQGSVTLTAVPVPAAIWLFGSALIGLGGIRRRQRVGG